MQMWSVWICMQSSDLISYHAGLNVISIIFMWGRRYEKHTCKNTDEIVSIVVVHCQYVVRYAYSRYVNVFLLRKKEDITGAHRTLHPHCALWIRSWFCCSAHRSVIYLPWLPTLPALLCKQMFSLSLMPNSCYFSHLEKVFLRAKGLKSDEKQHKLPPSSAQWERGRVVNGFFRGEKYSKATETQRQQFIHHTCDALFWATKTHDRDTDGYATAGGYVLRKKTWALWEREKKKALSATEDTLRTLKSPVCQCFFSALCLLKLRW